MFHRGISLKLGEGTVLEVTFQDGLVKRYDLKTAFSTCEPLRQLENRELFVTAQMNPYGIIWNEDLDFDMEEIYVNGETIGKVEMPIKDQVGAMITEARWSAGLSQTQLGKLARVDQADISKLEVGEANPTITTLDRIAKAMGKKLKITME